MSIANTTALMLPNFVEYRDQFRDGFRGESSDERVIAVVETVRRYRIPRQFVFDPIVSADTFNRLRCPDTWGHTVELACRFGAAIGLTVLRMAGVELDQRVITAVSRVGALLLLVHGVARLGLDLDTHFSLIPREVWPAAARFSIDDPQAEPPTYEIRREAIATAIHLLFDLRRECRVLIRPLPLEARRMAASAAAIAEKWLLRIQRNPMAAASGQVPLGRDANLWLCCRHFLGVEQS